MKYIKTAHYSVKSKDQIFVKSYGLLCLANYMSKIIGKNMSKNLTGKYSQKHLDHINNLLQMHLKLLQKEQFQKKVEASGYLIGYKITEKIRKVSRTSPQYSSGTVESETDNIGLDKEVQKERYTSLEKRQKFIDNLRLIR